MLNRAEQSNPNQVAFMPTGDEAFKVIRTLDLAFKIEMVLYKLYSLIWWVSLSELGIFLFLFIIFLDEPMEM